MVFLELLKYIFQDIPTATLEIQYGLIDQNYSQCSGSLFQINVLSAILCSKIISNIANFFQIELAKPWLVNKDLLLYESRPCGLEYHGGNFFLNF